MAQVLDSAAVFRDRVRGLQLDEFWDGFVAQGWCTHGTWAFSSTYVPGAIDGEPFDLVVETLTSDRNHMKKAALRRLF